MVLLWVSLLFHELLSYPGEKKYRVRVHMKITRNCDHGPLRLIGTIAIFMAIQVSFLEIVSQSSY